MDRRSESSRRVFLKCSLACGAAALAPWGCGRSRQPAAAAPPADNEPPATKARDEPASEKLEPGYLKLERSGELERRADKLWELAQQKRCCPRRCKKKRPEGEPGECGATLDLKVSSASPHFGEEDPLVGRDGSGTIFFSHCNLLCVFCQNWQIAHRGDGHIITHTDLADVMIALQNWGCHNVNLVTPSHVVHHLVKALRIAIGKGLRLPLVYNTGGYDSLEVIKLLDGVIDIYMPDFKFQDGRIAEKYTLKAADYPQVAATAISEMHRQVGVLQLDQHGVATRGLILRHLVMPQNLAGTERFTQWVAKALSPNTYVNLMAQYRPEHKAGRYKKLDRPITSSEWRQAISYARRAGLKRLARS